MVDNADSLAKQYFRQMQQERVCHQREVTTLLDCLPAFVFFKNDLCIYVTANQTFCQAIGYSLAEIIGKTDYDLFSKERADKYRHDDLTVLSQVCRFLLVRKKFPMVVNPFRLLRVRYH
ncbi:PAS domain-containing protein [Sporomusaceae bacterium BoRhaA]|uniref:PAS domain-containing protein n=1 Tax=Pelorhabdus rhamnosifermentans TaxID=2772457 RepID=UPI001C0618F2|nr:PAS domain-containing protein [Pelorhabdus rhamnosifermentans]MBU2701457.1 PAS domain-containing protein [Pelorhabdus rhamnosifermentans]